MSSRQRDSMTENEETWARPWVVACIGATRTRRETPTTRTPLPASFIGSWPLALHPVRKCRVRGDSTSPHPKLQAPACSHGRAPGRAGGHFRHVRPAQMTTGSPSARFLGQVCHRCPLSPTLWISPRGRQLPFWWQHQHGFFVAPSMNQHPTMTPAGFRQLLQMAKANIYNSMNHTYLLGTNCNGHHHVDGTYSSTLNGGN